MYKNTNGVPRGSDERVHHLCVKEGDVEQRILLVGSPQRAAKLATLFDDGKFITMHADRGFQLYTGKRNGVPITIISTGMGVPNMDFVVRETRAVVNGPMAIIRFGTCGGLSDKVAPGSVVVSGKGSIMVRRNPDAFFADNNGKLPYYDISRIMPASERLSQALLEEANKLVPKMKEHRAIAEAKDHDKISVYDGINVTACSFYSSQGRLDPAFDDFNETILEDIKKKYPDVYTMEMESYHLLDLAHNSKGSIQAATMAITLSDRTSGYVISNDLLSNQETTFGAAVLDCLAKFLFA